MTDVKRPAGFGAVTPYLMASDAKALAVYMVDAFGGEIIESLPGPDDTVMHVQVKIDDGVIMVGQSPDPSEAMPACTYLYVADADAVHAKALAAGGTEFMPVGDQFYGDRHGGLRDPFGNLWFVASFIEEISSEELMRRHAEDMERRAGG
ncbi:MAG: VOC family protein [Pseudomonadota bacterium]